MTPKTELLFEGSYLYYNRDTNFCQENFKFVQDEAHHYHIYAEVLSRAENGEFLKVVTRYEMTNHFIPYLSRVEKSIGNKYILETCKVDLHNQELHYTFEGPGVTQEFKRPHSSKHYLTSPAFAASAMWTLSKKFDATGRTAVTLVTSNNNWTYEGPPSDKIIYAEFKSREVEDFRLNNTSLAASHLCLYEYDTSATATDVPVDVYISKHFAIPYQLVQGDTKIIIKALKKHA